MGGPAGELFRQVGDGVAGLVGGAVVALIRAFWTIVAQFQEWLPGPLFPIVVGGAFVALVYWTVKK